jgi:ectoine hydroxylase-related dioxygenase (phytanoyl-CoA dioxygenase family)
VLRAFTLSPRIAGICGALLGVDAVRLYHDNLLSKEPGCGRTPWHFDAHHFPLATNDVVTAWIPAQAIPREMGPLAFARPIDAWRQVDTIAFDKTDDSYDRQVAETFKQAGADIDDGPFEEGEVSFHHNLSFHTAGGNATTLSRVVLANTYFADGARVVDAPTQVSGDWRKFIPETEPGEIAASRLNPVCWPAGTER